MELLNKLKEKYTEPQEYARLARYVRDESGYPEDDTDGFAKDVTAKVKRDMAEFLLKGKSNDDENTDDDMNEPSRESDISGERDTAPSRKDVDANRSNNSQGEPSVATYAEKIDRSITGPNGIQIFYGGRQ